MLSEKQRGVLGGMVAGMVVTALALGLAIARPPDFLLSQALRWDVLLVFWLALNIGMLARHRFFTPEDIDGGGLTKGTETARLLQSILQNTLEQVVLAFTVHLVWMATMPEAWQAAVPAAAILFFVGRLLFWQGYSRGAPSRAFGFALTFYPSVAMLVMMLLYLLLPAGRI